MNSRGRRIFPFFRLYRWDVAFITFCAAMAGPFFSYGKITFTDVGIAAFIAGILYNYVYVLNAVTDRREDAVNHPERPLPAGEVTLAAVGWYAVFLGVASVVGSLFLFAGRSLFLALLVPFFGTLYSASPFAVKRFPFAAILVTAWGLVHPFFIMADPTVGWRGVSFIVVAAAVVLFKDIADTAGDREAGRHPSVGALLPPFAIGWVSLFLLGAGTVLLSLSDLLLAVPLPLLVAVTLVWHMAMVPHATWQAVIYTRLIRTAAVALLVVMSVALWRIAG